MKTYIVDGVRIANKEGFFRELGRAVNGPGGYFGSNLDALEDCLRGGFGTPEDEPFAFAIEAADHVHEALGDDTWATVQEIFASADVPLELA